MPHRTISNTGECSTYLIMCANIIHFNDKYGMDDKMEEHV